MESSFKKRQVLRFKTDSRIWTIVTSPDNKLISCICDCSINIWDFQTKLKLIHKQSPHLKGYGLCSSKDQSIFISSGSDGLIKIWRLNDDDNNQKSLTLTKEIKAAVNYISKVIIHTQYISKLFIIVLLKGSKYVVAVQHQGLIIIDNYFRSLIDWWNQRVSLFRIQKIQCNEVLQYLQIKQQFQNIIRYPLQLNNQNQVKQILKDYSINGFFFS